MGKNTLYIYIHQHKQMLFILLLPTRTKLVYNYIKNDETLSTNILLYQLCSAWDKNMFLSICKLRIT